MFANELFGPVRQWGYLVKDLDQAMDAWVNQLGVGPFWGFRSVQLESNFESQQSSVTIDVGLAYQNGVQIELIQQTNLDAHSPYSAFYKTDAQQIFQQIAYFCLDINDAVNKARKLGFRELGYVTSNVGTRYYYFDSPALNGLVIELMQVDEGMVQAFEFCAQEAETWDGSNPYRLISMT